MGSSTGGSDAKDKRLDDGDGDGDGEALPKPGTLAKAVPPEEVGRSGVASEEGMWIGGGIKSPGTVAVRLSAAVKEMELVVVVEVATAGDLAVAVVAVVPMVVVMKVLVEVSNT
jgi:hypothetical protein